MTYTQLDLPLYEPTREEIEHLKSQIRHNAYAIGNMFSGEGEVFQTALNEVKEELTGRYVFEYHRAADVYTISKVTA